MRNRVAIVSALVFVAIAPSAMAANVNEFIDFSLRAADNSLELPGRLYVPPTAPDPSPRPLILFLHGGGEVGTDNVAQVNINIDGLLAEAKSRGAFLYAPQTDTGWGGSTILTRTMTMIDRAIAEHEVDRNRLYVTGLSSGGGGVWNMLIEFPGSFAAGVPIAPVTPFPYLPARLVGQPIWDFHARTDGSVPVEMSRMVISDIVTAAGQEAPIFPPLNAPILVYKYDNDLLDLHYTQYLRGGHSIWHEVYLRQEMYDWMFSRTLVPEPSPLFVLAIVFALTTPVNRIPFYIRRRTSAILSFYCNLPETGPYHVRP